MIFASDLDRTLIYSEKFIEYHPTESYLVEADCSKTISYITTNCLEHLRELNSRPNFTFIPVTTRSILEYNRINMFGLEPEFAIVSNGGHILRYGQPMKEWDEYIDKHLDRELMNKIVEEFNNLKSVDYKAKIVDDRFVFSKSKDLATSVEELKVLQEKYPEFIFCLDKHKLYAIPVICSKGNALLWIKELIGNPKVVAAGDGPLDIPMLNIADVAIMPEHKTYDESRITAEAKFDVSGGVNASEKILDIVEGFHTKWSFE